jgi:uncharacterized membrane protein YdbT with pleckstrin-like domain
MSYVNRVLQPDEQIRHRSHVHWIIFLPGIGLGILAGAVYFVSLKEGALWGWIAAALAFYAAIELFRAWFKRVTTEIAVTNRRIIYKHGFISRSTIEMQMDKVESVDVQQSVWGRLLDYGDITVRGVGVGIETLKSIDTPIEFRNHVTGER